MQELIIEGSLTEPKVHFNPQNGKMEIDGRSIPEDAVIFYAPLIDWLNAYKENPQQFTEFHLKLEYFNTSSSKIILDMLKVLRDIYQAGNDVLVHWYYEEDDDDILHAGEDYESIVKLPFKMIETDEEG